VKSSQAYCCNTSPPDVAEWKAFLAGQQASSVYHTPEFVECLRRAQIELFLCTCRDQNGKLAGLAPIILDKLAPIPLLGYKAFAPAGMLAENQAVYAQMQAWCDSKLAGRALYFEQFIEDDARRDWFDYRGFRVDEHRNFLISLAGEAGAFRHAFSRAISRNVRRGKAMNLRWEPVRDPEGLRQALGLLNETCQRVQAPCLPWPLLRAVFRVLVPREMARIYLVWLKVDGRDVPINARVELMYHGKAIDWYTGSAESHIHTQAGTWLVDKILEDLQAAGMKSFDFGGGGRVGEDYGPAEFKRRFGGKEIRVTRFQRVYHPRLLKLASRGWKLIYRPDRVEEA
jgi:hypothetical protein